MNEKDFIYSKDIKLNGVVKWSAPSNIAIVKYWGKLENQIPQNPSISLTLSKSITNTSLSLTPKKNKTSNLHFEFEGEKQESFEKKTLMFLNKIEKFFPFIKNHDLEIKSNNTFPHSSGIASSASSMAALLDSCRLLQARQVDVMLAGASDRCMEAPTYAKFSAIGALSPTHSTPMKKWPWRLKRCVSQFR